MECGMDEKEGNIIWKMRQQGASQCRLSRNFRHNLIHFTRIMYRNFEMKARDLRNPTTRAAGISPDFDIVWERRRCYGHLLAFFSALIIMTPRSSLWMICISGSTLYKTCLLISGHWNLTTLLFSLSWNATVAVDVGADGVCASSRIVAALHPVYRRIGCTFLAALYATSSYFLFTFTYCVSWA